MQFNSAPVNLSGPYRTAIDIAPQVVFRGAKWDDAVKYFAETSFGLTSILDLIARDVDFDRHVNVDFKYQKLRRGQSTCIPGWHVDGSFVTNPRRVGVVQPERYWLFVVGLTGRTQFMTQWQRCGDIDIKRSVAAMHCPDEMVQTIPSHCIARYDSFQIHRGGIAEVDAPRVMLRVTESSVIKPTKFKMERHDDLRM